MSEGMRIAIICLMFYAIGAVHWLLIESEDWNGILITVCVVGIVMLLVVTRLAVNERYE